MHENVDTFTQLASLGTGLLTLIAALVSVHAYFSPGGYVKRLDATKALIHHLATRSVHIPTPADEDAKGTEKPIQKQSPRHAAAKDVFVKYQHQLENAHFITTLGSVKLLLIMALGLGTWGVVMFFGTRASEGYLIVSLLVPAAALIVAGFLVAALAFYFRRDLDKKVAKITDDELEKFLRQS